MPNSRFIAFHRVTEAEALGGAPAPTFAVVIACGPAGVVLVFNRYRRVWELPGGLIDPRESARDSAIRELAEEAECAAESVDWLGVVEVDDERHQRGAVFGCTVSEVPAHVCNDEIDGIAAWTPGSSPQPLGSTDRALLETWARTGPLNSA